MSPLDCLLFGFGHWLFETGDCGGKGFARLLQAAAENLKRQALFFLFEENNLGFRETGNVLFLCEWFGL